jgi:hypothetical protein
MTYAKFGFAAQVKSTVQQNSNSSPKSSNKKTSSILVRVVEVVLDENHNDVKDKNIDAALSSIGLITCTPIDPNLGNTFYKAYPINSNKTNIPLINETVLLTPSPTPNSAGGIMWFYGDPIALYGNSSINNNSSPPIIVKIPKSPTNNYSTTQLGSPIQSDIPQEKLPLNSQNNPSQATFEEKSNINPLMQFAGDITFEGRFGQSLRFGNTAKSNSNYKNNWSESGENGDPITILRNGNSKDIKLSTNIPITEKLKDDLSSLYLTSYQMIPIGLANENFKSYSSKPTTPASFNKPQNILNSDRIIINAKSDSVLISAQKSVGILSNESINIESQQIYMDGTDIKIGSKDATESALLGDLTVFYIEQLAQATKMLALVIESSQLFPGGVPMPNNAGLLAGQNASVVIQDVLSNLNSLKSKIVKVK